MRGANFPTCPLFMMVCNDIFNLETTDLITAQTCLESSQIEEILIIFFPLHVDTKRGT